MSALIEYAAMMTEPFSKRPFGVEDSMVLSALAYLKFDGFVSEPNLISHSMSIYSAASEGRIAKLTDKIGSRRNMRDLLEALAVNPRFRNARIKFYSTRFSRSVQKQFSAVTFLLDDMTAYIAIRGTDSTLVGWRENLTMAYEYPIPAQTEAVEYLERVAKLTPRKLRIGGHSKGGNLAIYAAMNASRRTLPRIIDIYNLDGPGFSQEVLDTDEYKAIDSRVTKILPTGSLIGTLLRQDEDYRVVKSEGKGFAQHELFSWKMKDNRLDYAEALDAAAVRFDMTLDRWLAGMTDSRRREVVGLIFRLMDITGVYDLNNLLKYYREDDKRLRRAVMDFDTNQRRVVFKELASLAAAYVGSSIAIHSRDGSARKETK